MTAPHEDHPPIKLDYAVRSTRSRAARNIGIFWSILCAAIGVVLCALGLMFIVEAFMTLPGQMIATASALLFVGSLFCFWALRIQRRHVLPVNDDTP